MSGYNTDSPVNISDWLHAWSEKEISSTNDLAASIHELNSEPR
jgi:hypothetical protein